MWTLRKVRQTVGSLWKRTETQNPRIKVAIEVEPTLHVGRAVVFSRTAGALLALANAWGLGRIDHVAANEKTVEEPLPVFVPSAPADSEL